MTPLLLLVAISPVAVAAPPATPDGDFRSYVDQARFFMKKSWYADAAEQLELAIRTEDGTLDPEAWFLLATVRYKLAQLSEAREAADRALVNSRSADQTRQAEEFLNFLDEQFGIVELTPPRPGVATRLHVELKSVIFDPQLKEYFTQLTGRLEEKITLPYALGLPAGSYAINGETIEIEAGGQAAHDVAIRGGGPTGLQLLEMETSFGVQALFGEATSLPVPMPQLELGLSQPFGLFFAGAMASWTIHPIRTPGGILVAPNGWSAGAKLGVHPGSQELLSLRPAIAGRYGAFPGIRLGCDRGSAPAECALPSGAEGTRDAYAVGRGAMVGGELAVLYGDRTRRHGLSAGLKTAVDGLWGSLPEEGALLDEAGGEGRSYRIVSEDRSWSAVGLRVHFTVSYSF